tara:strand:- start:42 stop:584 length:543 start_codon:yes stop_codon:yes gene_type:complete
MLRLLKEYPCGIKLLKIPYFKDERGVFCKFYNSDLFNKNKINFSPKEHFYSISKKNVLRGMHFQIEGASHTKLISCVSGVILDVVVDIRKNSKYFNKPLSFKLSSYSESAILIPKGFAHGFLTISEKSIVQYLVSEPYDANLDKGVRWDSIDFDWNCIDPLISDRDSKHPSINNQEFIFE